MKNIIRKDEQAVSPVIATILMVAITVVLAAVLYVMVSGLLVGPGASKPVLTFSQATLSGGNATLSIASVSQSVAPSNYRVNLIVDGTAGGATAMPTANGGTVTVTVSTIAYTIQWTDIGGENTVNGGDSFRVSRPTGLAAATDYTFVLLWSDGSQIQSSAWSTP